MLLSLLTCTIFIGAAPTAADEPTGGNDKQENAVLNCDFDFAVVPAAPRPLSRPGLFTFPPTGPGAYSACDFLTGVYREKPPPYPFVPLALSTLSFFDADWRFVDNPDYCPDFLEQLKRIRVGDNWLFNTGGQSWMRYQFEYNSRITGINNDYLLFRVRPYADVWYRDQFRFFVEGYFGDSLWHDVPPLGTDVNRADLQNLFVEAKLGEWYSKPVYARVGRQEIQLGSQRLVGTPNGPTLGARFKARELIASVNRGTWTYSGFSRCSQIRTVSIAATTIRTSPAHGPPTSRRKALSSIRII